MKKYEYPIIETNVSPERQVAQLKNYMCRLVDALNENREESSAIQIFNEAVIAMRKTGNVPLEMKRAEEYKALRGAIVSLATQVIMDDNSYFEEDCGTLKKTGIITVGGGSYTIAGLIKALVHKIQTLEKEVEELKGD